MSRKLQVRSTTVLAVRRDGKVVMAGDGQVTMGEGVVKHTAKKIRRLYQDKILAGFAGSTADALAAPWRRVDPKHEFIVNLLSNLGSEDSTDQFASANGKADTLGHWIGSGRHHGTGSSHV